MPVVPDLGLDAIEILPGGEIAFSIEQDLFSESLGLLREGDMLSHRGRVLRSYADFSGAFGPEPPAADQGLDALHRLNKNEILFSVKRDFFSERLSQVIRRGDVLSSLGVVVKTNEQLIARFNPVEPKKDYGLDAIWIWPSGEIWFSLEAGFTGNSSESYGPGDLLSDQGYVVFRNLELVGAFAPLEDLGDFGLDSLFMVTDEAPSVPGSRFTHIRRPAGTTRVELEWEGEGRVFQVQRARDITGPYLPVSEIGPDLFFRDTNAVTSETFYRLQQW